MTLRSAATYYISPNLFQVSAPTETGSQSAAALATFHSEVQYGTENEQLLRQRDQLLTQVNPFNAAAAVTISQKYPWLSPGIVTGAAIAGINADDPALQWIADREAQTGGVGNGLLGAVGDILASPFTLAKGGIRMVTTGFDFLWEEGLARPLRTAVGISQNIDSPYERAGASIGTRAIGEMFGGEGNLDPNDRIEAFIRNVTPLPSKPGQGVNLGSGWLPQSNVANPADPQVRALSELYQANGMPGPNAQAQAIASVQQSYGTPITKIARQQAETGIQISDRRGTRVGISPGRLLAVGMGQTADTFGFNLVSGITDFSAQIALDPSNIALGGISKARLASRLLTNNATRGSRVSRVFGQNITDFTNSSFYQQSLLPRLAEMDNIVDIRNSLGLKAGPNTKEIGSTRALLADIRDASNPGAVDAALRPHLGKTIRKTPQPTNLITMMGGNRTVGQRIGGSESIWRMLGAGEEAVDIARAGDTFGLKVGMRHRLEGTTLGRLFSEMPDRMLDTSNMDSAFFSFGNFLDNAGLTVAQQNDLLYDFARLGNDDSTGAFQVVKRAMAYWETETVTGMVAKGTDEKQAKAWAHSFTRMFDSQDEWVKYWTNQQGNHQWWPGAKFNVIANGEVHTINAKPTVHLISELVTRQLPLPDPREMRRILSEVSSIPVAKLTATRTLKHGTDAEYAANVMTNAMDFYMSKFWKPMVLLRFAWPIRVIGEEQFRMGASGKFSAIRHPMTWLAVASGRKANRTLMRELPSPKDVDRLLKESTKSGVKIDVPAALDDFYSGLAASHGGWLTTKGQTLTVGGYGVKAAGDAGYVDAWLWNIAKLNTNGNITRMLYDDGIEATADYLMGDGQALLRKLRDVQGPGELRTRTQVHQYLQSVEARTHATAGGGYIWPDFENGVWRNHYNDPMDAFPDGTPLPEFPMDPNQPPLPGMTPPTGPTPNPGLGDGPFTPPHPGQQGAFDTDFQPRIQRERVSDVRWMDRYLDATEYKTAAEVGVAPGLFGDSMPLDRTWAEFTGRPDEDVLDFMFDNMRDWNGGTDFAPLYGVDDNLDVAMQELLLRYPDDDDLLVGLRSAYNRAGRDIAEADTLHEIVADYRKWWEWRAEAQNMDSSSGYVGEAMDLLDGRNVITRSEFLQDTASAEALFVSSLLDDIATADEFFTFNELLIRLDGVAEDMRGMGIWSVEMDDYVRNLRHNLERAANPPPVKPKNAALGAQRLDDTLYGRPEWHNVVIEEVGDDMFEEASALAVRLANDPPRPRLARGYASETHALESVGPRLSVMEQTGSTKGLQVAKIPDGAVPEISLSRMLEGATADEMFDMLDYLSTGAYDWMGDAIELKYGRAVRELVERNGYRVNIDAEAVDLVARVSDDFDQWLDPLRGNWVQGRRLPKYDNGVYDVAGQSHGRTPLLSMLTRELQNNLPHVRSGAEEVVLGRTIQQTVQQGRETLHGFAKFIREDLMNHGQEGVIDATLRFDAQRFGASQLGSRSPRAIVSDILQYGETWKGMDSENGLVMWSENIAGVLDELVQGRNVAIANDTLAAYEDEIVDAIAEMAYRLGVDPNSLYDSFDDAVRNGQELAGMGLEVAPSYRSPLTPIELPTTVREEMVDRTVHTLDEFRELDDDAPMYVYSYVSQEEARMLSTEGWDGADDLLVTPNPEIASYYTAPLRPFSDEIMGLGHGRGVGDPLEGILKGGQGGVSSNMLGPGLYTTGNGDILAGYTSPRTISGVHRPSITELRWLGDGEPRLLVMEDNLTTDFLDELQEALLRYQRNERLDNWHRQQEMDYGRVIDDMQLEADFESMSVFIDDAILNHRAIVENGGDIPIRSLWNELSSVGYSSIMANDLLHDIGYKAFRHEGGLNSGGQHHQTFVWLWKTLDEGLIEGLETAPGNAATMARISGRSASNQGKLVAFRVPKRDVKPAVMFSPDSDPAEIIMSSGMSARLSRRIEPEEVRIVDRSVIHMEEGKLGPYKGISGDTGGGSLYNRSRNLDDNTETYVGPTMYQLREAIGHSVRGGDEVFNAGDEVLKSLRQAQAKGLRVQLHQGVGRQSSIDGSGDTLVVSIHGGEGQILEFEAQGGFIRDITNGSWNPTKGGHLGGFDAEDISAEVLLQRIDRMKASANGGAWYRTTRTTTTPNGKPVALNALPDDEAAILRDALIDMPQPKDSLTALPEPTAKFPDPPLEGPPAPPLQPKTPEPETPRMFHMYGDADEGVLELVRNRKIDDDIKLPGELEAPSDEVTAYLANLVDTNRAPAQLPYRKLEAGGDEMGKWDSALSQAFYFMMSKPTNYLSRSPAWKQSYTQRVLELRSFATREVQQQIDELLYKSVRDGGFGWTKGEARKLLGQTPFQAGQAVGDIKSMRTIDDIAKAFALEETKNLLYDATKRHNISDITRNIFPFAEAWAEVIGVWSRIMWEHPEVLRRMQQGIEGARESGIFYDDENGEEVFSYPGLGMIGNWLTGTGDQAQTEFRGRVSGLNIALGGFVPGFGPMVQLPVSYAAEYMPTGWDFVEDFVLPFGASDVTFQPGDLVNAAMPAWGRRLMTSLGKNTEAAQQTYFNTVIDIFKLKSQEDARILDDPALADIAMGEAYQDATELSLFRSFAQFFLPTGPQISYQAKDKEGKWWALQVLGSEYYQMLRANDGDEWAATQEFVEHFGMNPMSLTTSKTVRAFRMPTTASGDDWARSNADLFEGDAYPTTAYYAQPDVPWEEFDWDAYRRQLEADARQGVNPQVWLWRRNQMLGGLAYDHAREELGDRSDKAGLSWLRQVHADLQTKYPGFGYVSLPGVPGRATLDQKMAELERWNRDPRLGESSAGKALNVYLEYRRQAQLRSMEHGLSPSGYQTAKQMQYIREWLRENAAVLMATYPDFSALWFDVFAAELEEDRATTEPQTAAGITFKETA